MAIKNPAAFGWKTRALKAESEIDRLTRERDEARADRGQLLAAAMTMKQFASEGDLAGCTTAFGVFMRRPAAIEHCASIIRAALPEKTKPAPTDGAPADTPKVRTP